MKKKPRKRVRKRAAFLLHVHYLNGVEKEIASIDRREGKYVPWDGLLSLETHIIRRADRIKEAVIYDQRGGGKRAIRHYEDQTWKIYTDVHFK